MSKNSKSDLNNYSEQIDALIGQKISEKIAYEMAQANKKDVPKIIKDFYKVPSDLLFTKNTIFMLFNRKTGLKSFINGTQADSIIGIYNDIRQNLVNKVVSNFTAGEYYVEFASAKVFELEI
ncbi:MAG: hypothetical protein PHV68_08430 [Candidatus Gastranaerophilales bacterium]|nr:hypothetical protein [Candidatus Gastranaerophilales bacterium]